MPQPNVPPARRTPRARRTRPKPAPGTVEVRLRAGSDAEMRALIEAMRAAGITVWHAPDKIYEDTNGAVRRYLAVDLRGQA